MTHFEFQTDQEEKINDLARLTHTIHIVWASIAKELKVAAASLPQVALFVEDIEADREVLQDFVEDAEMKT
jgi:hypothetical protein